MNKLRKLARGRDCQVRIPGVCNYDPDTTVLAHLGGAGMGMKANDLHGAWACSSCHDALDHRTVHHIAPESLALWHLEGVIRTQEILIQEGRINAV